jgi:hypothetical protein
LDDFFPLVASVLRNTDRADNPDDEYFWKVLSKDQVRGYFDAVRRRHGERRPYRYRCVDENDSVPLSVEAEEAAVTTDIRSWFDDVRAGYENSGRA